jgi:uncharacterized membrane protein
MSLLDILNYTIWNVVIEFIGALILVGYVVAALVSLFRTRNIVQARLLVAEGAIMGLSFKLAGTLLRTIELHTWEQILLFVAIFALRTVLKRLFTWEQSRLRQVISQPVFEATAQAKGLLSDK